MTITKRHIDKQEGLKMIDSIAHFVETLTDDQKRVLYLLSGYALELQNSLFFLLF